VHVLTQEAVRQEPRFTKFAFTQLLEWLDDGVESHGNTYLEIHRRLISYFDRRNRPSPHELADETLNRIARTLEKDGVIETRPPARYCYVVARFVLLEDIRRDQRMVRLDERSRGGAWGTLDEVPTESREAVAAQEQRLECLEGCLQKLTAAQRELIVEYYRGGQGQQIERRRDMAKRLGITMNALGIRVCRIRSALESCVEACRKEG
jgi:DNA-directed RNA polymerase specialized sigma24 family protein